MNPVRAGLVQYAWEWPGSSAPVHVTGIDPTGLLDMDLWRKRFTGDEWKEFFQKELQNMAENEILRCATRTGRPLGSEEFLSQLEALTGRNLHPRKPGPQSGLKRPKRI
jgi:putative transposase